MNGKVDWYVLQSWSKLRATLATFNTLGAVLFILGALILWQSANRSPFIADGEIAIVGGIIMVLVANIGGGYQTLRLGITSKRIIIVRPYKQIEVPASEVLIVLPRYGGQLKEFFSISFKRHEGSPWMKDVALPVAFLPLIRAAGVRYLDEPSDLNSEGVCHLQ